MTPLTDMYGNPLLTLGNLMLFIIYFLLIYGALSFRLSMVLRERRPKKGSSRWMTP